MAIQYPQSYDDDFINIIKKVIDHVNVHGKTIQDLVAEGQLTEEQYAELITVINGLIKSGNVDKSDLTPEFKDEIERFSAQLAQKAQQISELDNRKTDKDYVDQQISNVASGTPKGGFETLSELENEHPNGDTGIYVVSADGNWYYYDGAAWQAGGVYQTTQWQNALTTQNEPWEVL